MEQFALNPEIENPEDRFLNEGRDNNVPVVEEAQDNREAVYENAERLTGVPYFNYLRAHDDML